MPSKDLLLYFQVAHLILKCIICLLHNLEQDCVHWVLYFMVFSTLQLSKESIFSYAFQYYKGKIML